jgi:hypothetical protein
MKHEDIDHTGLTGAGGSVATDAIWDAAGDLAVGSGANTAAKLSIGATNGMAVQRVSGAVAWALPPGYEFDYVQITSPVAITATSGATANTVVTGNAVTYDGSTVVLLHFYAPNAYTANLNPVDMEFWLYDGSSEIGRLGTIRSVSTNRALQFIKLERRFTPSAAAHTYSIRASQGSSTAGQVTAGSGGSGNDMPAFIRITKV